MTEKNIYKEINAYMEALADMNNIFDMISGEYSFWMEKLHYEGDILKAIEEYFENECKGASNIKAEPVKHWKDEIEGELEAWISKDSKKIASKLTKKIEAMFEDKFKLYKVTSEPKAPYSRHWTEYMIESKENAYMLHFGIK